MIRDPSLDTLLHMDGDTYVINDKGYWVKCVVKEVPLSKERPHGLHYSLTLHDFAENRLLGFDNAHAISEGSGPGARTRIEYDHKHLGKTVRFYKYKTASSLIEDFWTAVDSILNSEDE